MKTDITSRAQKVWEERWARFALGLARRGVDPQKHEFCRAWVRGFVAFIKPKGFSEAGLEDVESYLSKLAASGKKGWQVAQAGEALQVMFGEVDPRAWANPWPETLIAAARDTLDRTEPADLPRGPVGDVTRFEGRTDSGEVPERYAGFLDQIREALRLERYSYRTQQTYAGWIKRFLIFAQPISRTEILWGAAQDYLDYLTLVRRVSGSTLNQALSALQFLFRIVLRQPAGGLGEVKRPPRSQRLPTVLGREEVRSLLQGMQGAGLLMAA